MSEIDISLIKPCLEWDLIVEIYINNIKHLFRRSPKEKRTYKKGYKIIYTDTKNIECIEGSEELKGMIIPFKSFDKFIDFDKDIHKECKPKVYDFGLSKIEEERFERLIGKIERYYSQKYLK